MPERHFRYTWSRTCDVKAAEDYAGTENGVKVGRVYRLAASLAAVSSSLCRRLSTDKHLLSTAQNNWVRSMAIERNVVDVAGHIPAACA